MDSHELELKTGQRFDFGANWQMFLAELSDPDIAMASAALLDSLEVSSLTGITFLDVGSGSGLSSLAAFRAGARVVSFDFDPRSVLCTEELRARSGATVTEWRVLRGSILDSQFVASLGEFDVVYSWGVLHHTGAMWQALDQAISRVAVSGQLFIALYNDQGWASRYWQLVKKTYNRSSSHSFAMIAVHAPYFLAMRMGGNILNLINGRVRGRRGMKFWRDVIDWLGGYPFEVADLHDVVRYVEAKGFRLQNMNAVGWRNGCNEWVFRRTK